MISENILNKINSIKTTPYLGRIVKVTGLVIEAVGLNAGIGELCYIKNNNLKLPCEVVGFENEKVLLMPLNEIYNIKLNSTVYSTGRVVGIKVGKNLIGRIVDGLGKPIDMKGGIKTDEYYSIYSKPPNPIRRKRIKNSLITGIKAIDGFLTIGEGQRVGLFAGSGIGKSTLVGMIARNSKADVNVIALIGERGREVKEFIEKDLMKAGMDKSVVVVSTSDQPALMRIKGAFTATSIAEYFRDSGKKVMLIMDSVTRFAMAQREVGLSIGEPPTVRGYPPSVFAMLPKLLERAGQGDNGSITGIYSVLVDGDDHNEPIADAIRGILDGHIVLSRELAHKNHYPAIDILFSLSRLMPDIVDDKHLQITSKIRDYMAIYRQYEDMIRIGAYSKGVDKELDKAIDLLGNINSFLKQNINESFSFEETFKMLCEIIK